MFYQIKNASISLDGNTILENINFSLKDKERIGLVGRNGSGKTTLLKAIIGLIPFEDGYDTLKIESSNDFKIGYVEQQIQNQDLTLNEYIKTSYQEIINIKNKIEQLEERIGKYYHEKEIIKYQNLLEQYNYLGGYNYQKEIDIALSKFGFLEEDKEKQLKNFSGGQLTKLSLLHLILSKPDLLILDEPTNHLDIKSICFLENYLKDYPKSMIIVSHDRMFLDKITTTTYEIENGFLKRYPGNYTAFLQTKKLNQEKFLKDYEKQEKEIKRLTAIADRFRYKPTKAKMAMSKLKQISRMQKLELPEKEYTKTFHIKLTMEEKSYHDVLKVKNLSVGYQEELATFNFELERGDKLGIIGENGIGKSTLLKTLVGEIPPLSGHFRFGERTKIGYFSQNFTILKEENSIVEEINQTFKTMPLNEIRRILGAFDFHGEEIYKKIKDLSGGEKVRLSLCKILNQHPNTLILDEPTNHLDIISKNTIEDILLNYPGTILLVSHDRYLINKVCNKVLVIENKTTKLYPYGYLQYEESRVDKENTSKEKSLEIKEKNKEKEITSKKEKKNNQTKELQKELNKVEKKIDKLEQEIKDLSKELLKEEVYLDREKALSIQNKIDELNCSLDENNKEWEELMEKTIIT